MIKNLHGKIMQIFSSRTPLMILLFCLIFMLFLGWLDVITGDYSLIVFYLIPVSLASWFVGYRSGLLFCVLAIVIRFFADGMNQDPASSHSTLHYWNEFIEFLFLSMMSLLFSALKKNLENEKELARKDPLTNTLNRRSFFDLAEHEINRSQRYDLPLTVAYIDLDNFKVVNDQLGHNTGDELLITVVSTIRTNIRSSDILARFGGDEFVILLPETQGEAAHTFLSKVHEHLNLAMAARGWEVSFSIGAASYIHVPPTVDEIISHADKLMYNAKRGGKNRLLHKEIGGNSNG